MIGCDDRNVGPEREQADIQPRIGIVHMNDVGLLQYAFQVSVVREGEWGRRDGNVQFSKSHSVALISKVPLSLYFAVATTWTSCPSFECSVARLSITD